MTLGRRLEKANEIARKRAERIRTAGGKPLYSPADLRHLSAHPPSKKDRPHKDVELLAFEPAKFRKFNGCCSCPTCKAAKMAGKYNSKGKNKRRYEEHLTDEDLQ